MSTIDDFLNSLSSNVFSMEETLDFSLDPTADVEQLSFSSLVEQKACLPVSSPHCGTPGDLKTELISTPGFYEESELAEQDFSVIPGSEPPLPIDEGLKEQLVEVGISEFNKRVKALGLDATTVQFLRTLRKKDKNRQAAIRSRARKESRLSELEKRVAQLQSENKSQHQLIQQLQERLRKAEQTASKGI